MLREVGGSFELADVPDAVASDGRQVVRVHAAGINFADVLIRRGHYPEMPELPVVLGLEVAGELEDGTRVIALTRGAGAYAELAAVDQVLPLPDGATFAEGAAFPIAFLTAYIPLTRQVRLHPGSTVLVHAAAGGVGSASVQVARALGANVIGAVGSAEKIELCLELGASAAYVYDDIPDDLRVDVVVDPVGGPLLERALGRLRPLGVLVAIGVAGGPWEAISPALLVGRNVGVQGFYLGRLMRHAPEIVAQATADVLELWRSGAVKPVVGAEIPLADVDRAHELVESRRSVGKVVLVP